MMKELKIATSASLVATIETLRQIVRVEQTDYTDVAAVVVSVADVNAGILARLQATGFDIPTFVAVEGDEHLSPDYLPFVSGVFALLAGASKPFYMAQLEAAADAYEQAAAAVLQNAEDLRRDGKFDLRLPGASGRRVLPQTPGRPAVLRFLR